MAEHRVHPTDSDATSMDSGDSIPPPPPSKPPPGTYVIQLPKDQVYRVPPPENANRFDLYTRRNNNNRHCSCRRFLCFILLITALLLLIAITSGLLFLILQPLSPQYSILAISANGIKPNASISPRFNLTVRFENPNSKIGIYYERNSTVGVNFSNLTLCEGGIPAFYQPSRNVTVVKAIIVNGSGIKLSRSVVKELKDSVKRGIVKLKVELRAPIKLKVMSMTTWRIRVKVLCEISVRKITGEMKVMDQKCEHSIL